jgi:3-oxoacyl-[acyl-carrier protein] reductase
MKNSVAIVTGASQGIGRSSAVRLARDFSAVVLAARNAKALEEVAAAVRQSGAEPLPLALDLSQVEAPKIIVNTTLERFGRIDALLNIAGAVPQIDLFEMTDEEWKAGMELKLHGARRLTIRAWDALKQAEGSVVFMSGRAALRNGPKSTVTALLTRMSRRPPNLPPNTLSTDAASAFVPSIVLRSALTASALPPASVISDTTCSARAGLAAQFTMR